jgi:hypothetical protein
MQRLINEARRALQESAEHEEALAAMHNEAAKKLAAAIKSAGLKTSHVPGSFWSSGVMIYYPKGARSGFDLSVIGQHSPRRGYQFAIKMMPPMMGGDHAVINSVWDELPFAWRDLKSMFNSYGQFKLLSTDRLVELWGHIPDNKVEKLIADAPRMMAKAGKRIARAFKEADPA